MFAQKSLQETLLKKLSEKKQRNPAFSMRAFAKQLNIGSSALSEILNGKRIVSPLMATKIIAKLDLQEREREFLLKIYSQESKKKLKVNSEARNTLKKEMMKLSSQDYEITANWHYFAILSLAETSDFDPNPESIAKRLNITKSQSKKALDRLIDMGCLKWEKEQLCFKGINIKTPDEIKSIAIKTNHLSQMELAKHSLMNDDISTRDFTSSFLAIDTSKLEEAKHLIRDFRYHLTQLLESGNQSEVYIFSNYLFPITRRHNEDSN